MFAVKQMGGAYMIVTVHNHGVRYVVPAGNIYYIISLSPLYTLIIHLSIYLSIHASINPLIHPFIHIHSVEST